MSHVTNAKNNEGPLSMHFKQRLNLRTVFQKSIILLLIRSLHPTSRQSD